tara:strand:+ start:41 stop:457 length:417 start_codon:yes stop_codon:yes gene_type:complete
MSTSILNFTSNDVDRNQVGQSYYTTSGDVSEGNIGNDHNVAQSDTLELPLITSGNLGTTVFFRSTAAVGGMNIKPKATNKIVGSVTLQDSIVTASGVLGKKFINTKPTGLIGDWCQLRAVSLTEWYIIGAQGIWASEA